MGLLLTVVFLSVFVVIALLLTAARSTGSQTEQTRSVLQAALAISKQSPANQVVDVRKEELLSSVPWLNRWLLKLELAPRLRVLLYQADVQWTAESLILMCAICFLIPAYLIYLRTGTFLFSLLIGLALGAAPLLYVRHKRAQRFDKFEAGLPEALDLIVSALRAGH